MIRTAACGLAAAVLLLGVSPQVAGQASSSSEERTVPVALHPGPLLFDRAAFAAELERLRLGATCDAANLRSGVLESWADQYGSLAAQLSGRDALPPGADAQVLDRHALCLPEDRDPLGVVLRRTRALLDHFARRYPQLELAPYETGWRQVARAEAQAGDDLAKRQTLYLVACALRRQLAFRNPLLDFDRVLFVARGNDTRDLWSHGGLGSGLHFITQSCAFASLPGGGIYEVADFKQRPVVKDQVAGRAIRGGPFDGRTIRHGSFMSPELSFDGRRLLFCWAPITHWRMAWEEDTVWHVYEAGLDGDWAQQLTSGPYNDFDPCYLPDGRVVFVSERRGGYARCFDAIWPTRNFVLHAMDADGGGIVPISWFESGEWQPSLAHDGRLVYSRWDYIDRDFGQGQNLWVCRPDGRDPRAPHGNYPQPHHVPADAAADEVRDGRRGRPFCEFSLRAIPGSSRFAACAVPQHGLMYGSLIQIDMRRPDDGAMSQVLRWTPYQDFPESEGPAFSPVNPSLWATPWPLDEDFTLCNYLSDICLLDRFGNLEVICEKQLIPGWERLLWANHRQGDNGFRLLDPIPVRPRPAPPAIPSATRHPADAPVAGPTATLGIINVYDGDLPLPEGTRIRWLRIVQHLVKGSSQQDDPSHGFGVNASPRMSLGLVPVEADGSVYCEAPVGKLLMFQLLDEDHRAVHGMRSATYVHPGEQLACAGCHERPTAAPPLRSAPPLAFRRPPSRLEPDVGGVEPITYFRTVRPVFESNCLPCHEREQRGPRNMAYALLKPYVWYYYGGGTEDVVRPVNGGTRTMPGAFGAVACRMGQALFDEDHRGKIPEEDLRRVLLWLDSNSPLYGADHSTAEQAAGELVWPKLDVDPENPQGLERLWDAGGLRSLAQPARLSISDFHRQRGTVSQMRERPDWSVQAEDWDGGPGEPRGWKRRTWNEWQER